MFVMMIVFLACGEEKTVSEAPPTVDAQLRKDQGEVEPPAPEEAVSIEQFEPDGSRIPVSDQGSLVIPTLNVHGSLNVHSSKYGIVFRFSEGCYVDVENTNDTQELECTPFMNDSSWLKCTEREISLLRDGTCRCHMPGEPPESGVLIDCPKPVE